MAYPGTLTFDLSEIVAELEISKQKFIPLTPFMTIPPLNFRAAALKES